MTTQTTRGLFISFEGVDGAGKTTQVERLAEFWRARGREVVVTREPGGTELGTRIRQLLLHGAEPIAPRTEALLFAADRAQHVAQVVRPALDRGAIVITDRYLDSSLAYQSGGRELTSDDVRALSLWATGGLLPARTYLLDIDPAVSLGRLEHEQDRMESAGATFARRTRAAFLTRRARTGAVPCAGRARADRAHRRSDLPRQCKSGWVNPYECMGFHCGPAARGGPAARRQQRRRARTGAVMAHLRAARVGPVACGARVRRGARKPRPRTFRNAYARDRAGARRHTPRRDDAHDRQSDDRHRRRAQPHRHGRADAKHGAVAHHHHRRRGPHARTHHERAAQGDRGAEPAHHLAAVCAERAGCAAHDPFAHTHRQSGRA